MRTRDWWPVVAVVVLFAVLFGWRAWILSGQTEPEGHWVLTVYNDDGEDLYTFHTKRPAQVGSAGTVSFTEMQHGRKIRLHNMATIAVWVEGVEDEE